MKITATRSLWVALLVAGLAGCQSSPRWAWWKPKDASEDASVLARSAAPELPSTQSTPQVAESGGLQPAAPPSSANLAAAGAQQATAATSIPASSAATISNAPLANYPSAVPGAATFQPTPSAAAAAPSAGDTKSAASLVASSPVPAAAASPPAAGPYDPNAFQLNTPLAAAPPAGLAASSADRYAAPVPQGTALPPSNPASAPPQNTPTPSVDRYAMPATMTSPATMPTASNAAAEQREVGQSGDASPDRYTTLPTTPVPVAAAPAAVTSSAATSVQLTTPAGQYRPGGTSSYTGGTATQQPVEVATRPALPSTTMPAQAAQPTSVPWTPPAAPTSDSGVRTY